ncbi:MAG TPA: DUF4178 domain-containing protein [Pyrinomonadaceae bacterium]|nr:DUF4178 domain-containing protein [Pyrinomonadaceae bacterium]
MALQANCPSCGAQVLFKTGSALVVVCEFCHSVVARTDRGIEDFGRVAEVFDSGSPLQVGLRGVCRSVGFELTGRAQFQHAAGGFWDEWYAAFADGRWGWLAEAQGRFYLTFRTEVPDPRQLPFFDALQLGQPITAIPARVPPVVTEKGEAQAAGAEGEIPYLLRPGERHLYADLSGPGGVFGTLDYGEHPPAVYAGSEVSLADLGLADAQRTEERAPRAVGAAQLNCPKCAGALELRAPDQSERVTCPYCNSLLDINQGRLSYLKTLEPKGPGPSIPLGSTAEFEGHPLTVIGFLVRSVEYEGVRYFWQEYLLYNPQVGFRWLVESDGHWSYVVTVPPADVTQTGESRAVYNGRTFKIFQDAWARVEYVGGEFYWKVSAGEQVRATDFVAAPQMLSREVSGGEQGSARKKKKGGDDGGLHAEEINWSLGTYLPVREVRRKFNVELPRPHTVAPNQPFPNKGIYGYWLVLTFLALLVGAAVLVTGSRRTVFTQSYSLQAQPAATATPAPTPTLNLGAGSEAERVRAALEQARRLQEQFRQQPSGASSREGVQVIFTDQFELEGRQNVRVSGTANVSNNWLYVAGDLINEETGLVQQFELPIEYYYGVEGGESWSEGGTKDSAYLSSLPAGRYTMRLEAQWENWTDATPPQLVIKVEQGVPRFLNLLLLVLALSAIPIFVAIRHVSFEARRWKDSEFKP